MRRKFVVGNWKMFTTAAEATRLAGAVVIGLGREDRVFGDKSAQTIVVQYGGSVKPDNAASFFSRQGVDGALIGGASLCAEQFLAIVRAGINELQTAGEAA